MKSITGIFFGFFILLLTCGTSWSDPLLVGDIILENVLAPASGQPGGDNLLILNLTGGNGADITDSLNFGNINLTINGGTPVPLSDIAAGNFPFFSSAFFPSDGISTIPSDSITSLFFTATIGSSPYLATLADGSGDQELISPDITGSYTGTALDSSTYPTIAIYATGSATTVPEPATILLLGIGFGSLWFIKRKLA
jgi:hypothetical protein